jgi:ABC-type transport system involved in multi-copper enzyme maturation permease subunit
MNLVKSEIRKAMYSKSVLLTFLGASLISILSSGPSAYISHRLLAEHPGLSFNDPQMINGLYSKSLSGYLFSAIFGIIVMAGEFKNQTAVRTFLASPKRLHVLLAKVFIAIIGGALTMLGSTILGIIAAHIALSKYPHANPTSDLLPHILLDALITGVSMALLGLAIGTLIRNQNTATTVTIVYLMIVERLIVLFWTSAGKWLPTGLLTSMMNVNLKVNFRALGMNIDTAEYLKPIPAMLLMLGYALIAGAIAVRVSLSRDVN